MMRAVAVITVAGLVSAALILTAGTGFGQPSTLQPVQDSEGRFVISLPPAWRLERSGGGFLALSALSPERPGLLSDSIEVYVKDNLAPLSPEACADLAAMAMRMMIHRWTTLSEGPGSVGGLPAYSRAYTWRARNGAARTSLQTCVTLSRRMFVIIGTTMDTPDAVAQNLPELARIMGTFRLGAAAVPPATGPGGQDRDHR